MKKPRTLTGTGANAILLSILSLVLLQACELMHTEVRIDCGSETTGKGGEPQPGPGGPCVKDPVSVGSPFQTNAIAVNNSNQPTGEQIPEGSKCDWTGGQNKKCRAPGTANCSFYPNATCRDTYNLSIKKCECGCF